MLHRHRLPSHRTNSQPDPDRKQTKLNNQNHNHTDRHHQLPFGAPLSKMPDTRMVPIANRNPPLPSLLWLLLLVVGRCSNLADSATRVVRPNGNAATLVPGQPLHFECSQIDRPDAQFVWFKQSIGQGEDSSEPKLLEPDAIDNIDIHNERLTLLKPSYDSIGDYICRALDSKRQPDVKESSTIKLRAQPFIDDFGIETSHTGKSATVTDGDRLELTCHIRDESVPVTITWVRSDTPEDESSMITLPEIDPAVRSVSPNQAEAEQWPSAFGMSPVSQGEPIIPTYRSPSNVIVERVDNFTKRLVIGSVGLEHRGHYACWVDNHVTEKSSKAIYIRVKDKIIALWPFLGILAELFILFTIIYVWETQRAQRASRASGRAPGSSPIKTISQTTPATSSKRPASGPTSAFENVPLTM